MSNDYKLLFQPGLIVNEEFFDYKVMQSSAKNWLFFTKYRFGTGNFYGRHDGVQLNHLQFGHADRHEGMMFEGVSPKDCVTLALLQKSGGRVCINGLKMEAGDIIVIDDGKPYDFVSSEHTLMVIVSITKSLLATQIPSLLNSTDKIFKDNNDILSNAIEHKWKEVLEVPNLLDSVHEVQKMEQSIVEAIKDSLSGHTGGYCHLTPGEKIALEIKSYLLTSMEETMSIHCIAEKFKVSEKTIESSFKSLFGITPKHFVMLLKLNHAHEDLQQACSQTTNVSDIAMKWEFSHFGRFASDYKSLFGVHPSITLKQEVVK